MKKNLPAVSSSSKSSCLVLTKTGMFSSIFPPFLLVLLFSRKLKFFFAEMSPSFYKQLMCVSQKHRCLRYWIQLYFIQILPPSISVFDTERVKNEKLNLKSKQLDTVAIQHRYWLLFAAKIWTATREIKKYTLKFSDFVNICKYKLESFFDCQELKLKDSCRNLKMEYIQYIFWWFFQLRWTIFRRALTPLPQNVIKSRRINANWLKALLRPGPLCRDYLSGRKLENMLWQRITIQHECRTLWRYY